MKNRFFVLFVFLLAAIFLSGCRGPDGDSSQKYWWAGSLGYIHDTNPSTPQTIYNNEYFATLDGDFYMEYMSWDSSEWYMDYTITVDPGNLFFLPGDDAWFEIDLLSTGPSLYEWDYARGFDAQPIEAAVPTESTSSTDKTLAPSGDGRKKTGILGTQRRTYDWGTVEIAYGRILP